jgi:hypothetical protein
MLVEENRGMHLEVESTLLCLLKKAAQEISMTAKSLSFFGGFYTRNE